MAGPATLDFTPYTKTDASQGTDVSIKPDAFAEVFASDLPPEIASAAAAGQHPLDAGALSEGAGPPAWTTIPSWYLIATGDNVIPSKPHDSCSEPDPKPPKSTRPTPSSSRILTLS